MARRLVAAGDLGVDKDEVITDCLGLGRQLALQRVVRTEESVSTELYDAAYRLADNRRLVSVDDGRDLILARQEWLAEIEQMQHRLDRIAAIEIEQAKALR